MIYSSRGNLTV